ncbi:DUF6415 family natural product biosynthesis protein [Streptomyces cinnabarinus]|uniref:DUF6415 family natural product biosynthesis protein n=1 Tax=Streptomyces cinnabarinus TaxID=67287 RepID=A0ABY7K8M6_9ACTN|nr:DUF6415 family natural product biosynthesis protein [Streptomyces cinnabarinus]WAZ20140.1 DUF6415 family natural product biosynthesis protein [Streptomyces cinnabarinus]
MTTPEPPGATDAPPVDIATMRANVAEVLPPEATPTDRATLEVLTDTLRHGVQMLIAEVERAAEKQSADDIPRYVALACVREARGKLDAGPVLMPSDAAAYVRKLGRSLLALCDHYEALAGIRVCLACDQPFKPDEATQPYDRGSPTGGAAVSGRIHERCVNSVRLR